MGKKTNYVLCKKVFTTVDPKGTATSSHAAVMLV